MSKRNKQSSGSDDDSDVVVTGSKTKKQKTIRTTFDINVCGALQKIQYSPDFLSFLKFILQVLEGDAISIDVLWSQIEHMSGRNFSTKSGVIEWLTRHGFRCNNNKISPPLQMKIKEKYLEMISFMNIIIVDNSIPPSVYDICADASSEVFEIKKEMIHEMFEWEGDSGFKLQLKEQIHKFNPTEYLCEVYIEEFKGIYLGSCTPRNDGQKYFAVIGYFTNNPVLITESRCDFGFRMKYRIPTEKNMSITHWENDERTIQVDSMTSPCEIALEVVDDYQKHALHDQIMSYLNSFLQGIIEVENVSQIVYDNFKSQMIGVITDTRWIIFSSLVKSTHLIQREKDVLDELSKNEVFDRLPVHWLTVVCLSFGRDPEVIKKYIKSKKRHACDLEKSLNWKEFNNFHVEETMDLNILNQALENVDKLIDKAISKTVSAYPYSKSFLSNKGKITVSDSEGEDDDDDLNRDPSDPCNKIDDLINHKKRFIRRHFNYIRSMVSKTINGETLPELLGKKKGSPHFYYFDDISLGKSRTAVPVVNAVDFSEFEPFAYATSNTYGEGITEDQREVMAALKNSEACDCKNKCGKGCKCLRLQQEFRTDIFDPSQFNPVRRGDEVYYDNSGKLRDIDTKYVILECNRDCGCSETCPNRVVQKGSNVKLCVFKTKNRGWGLRANQKLSKGQFVEVYFGELITDAIAEKRGERYDRKGLSYLFDLAHGGVQCEYTIDSTFIGNVTRFLNHSCDGNLKQLLVCNEIRDPRYGDIAFFCKRDIKEGEELTFDYEYIVEKRVKCLCGSKNCKGWLR